VRRLASDGASVAFTYGVSEDRAKMLPAEVEAVGGKVLPVKADSADAEAVKRAVAQTINSLGRLDILVNNAGILVGGGVDDYSLADFDRMVAVNVRAVFVAVQAAVPHLGAGGRIITTGSVTADRSGFPGASVYSMTKGAVAALTRGLARDLGPRGITVHSSRRHSIIRIPVRMSQGFRVSRRDQCKTSSRLSKVRTTPRCGARAG
jgi:3-oxoacyl-[acyl-carrier protein] reductase